MRPAFVALALFCLSACVQNAAEDGPPDGNTPAASRAGPSEEKSIAELRAESLAKIDRKACEMKGGTVRQEGMMGLWRCTLPYKDAGKPCRDGDECEGRCIANEASAKSRPSQKGEAIGVCEADDSPFGCYGLVEDGKTEGFICVD
jgi:hypothetical protein